MSASNEWWEYHLTPDGWVEGDFQLDFGVPQRRHIPENRVLTICESQKMSSPFSPIETTWTEIFRSDDEEVIKKLLELYGDHGFK